MQYGPAKHQTIPPTLLHTFNVDETEPITDKHNVGNSTITVHKTRVTTTVHCQRNTTAVVLRRDKCSHNFVLICVNFVTYKLQFSVHHESTQPKYVHLYLMLRNKLFWHITLISFDTTQALVFGYGTAAVYIIINVWSSLQHLHSEGIIATTAMDRTNKL